MSPTVASATEAREEFEARGYIVLKSLISRKKADFLADFGARCAAEGDAKSAAEPMRGTPEVYGDVKTISSSSTVYGAPMMESLMEDLVPTLEAALGRKLFPTFSMFRVYKTGDSLVRHKDRPACEISLSVCLGYRAPAPWPLYIEGPTGVFGAELECGDGLLYKGTLYDHWREPFAGESASQVFLFYVDQNGPCAEWRFDKRDRLWTLPRPGQATPVQSG